jgi:hypothetical protein
MQLCSWQLFHLKSSNYIWNSNFSNDHGWRNDHNKSSLSRKVVQLCSWKRFHLKSYIQEKLRLNFLKFKIQNFQTASDGEMTKTKVVDLKKS